MLGRALQEAQSVADRMAPGQTVVKNRTDLVPTDAKSQRSDKFLWMDDHGFNGPQASSGPTPTLALIESALADLGMQLDPRLQRSNLRIRITERCDGMLALYD